MDGSKKGGDPDGNRTRVTAVKGRCLSRLTIGPRLRSRLGALPPSPDSKESGSGSRSRTNDTAGMNRML